MIRQVHINQELKEIDKSLKGVELPVPTKVIITLLKIVVKLLRDIRFNQVRMMEKQGVELVKPVPQKTKVNDKKKGEGNENK